MDSPDLTPPQGIYGLGAAPLRAGEVWVQDTELVYVSAQVGLGKGVDVAIAALPMPYSALGGAQLGYSYTFGVPLTVRGTLGGYAREGYSGVAGGAIVGFAASWGTRGRHVQLTAHYTSETGYTQTITPMLDGVWTLGKHVALLGGAGAIFVGYGGRFSPGMAVAGPAIRFVAGDFSADLGLQIASTLTPGGNDNELGEGSMPIIPAPTLSLRYHFGR